MQLIFTAPLQTLPRKIKTIQFILNGTRVYRLSCILLVVFSQNCQELQKFCFAVYVLDLVLRIIETTISIYNLEVITFPLLNEKHSDNYQVQCHFDVLKSIGLRLPLS